MWHRHPEKATQERAGTSDPTAAAIWQEGHLTGATVSTPVIKAPRASELIAPSHAA